MATRRRGFWLITAVGLVLGACSGDDSSPTGSGGSSASGGGSGAGGSSDPGGAGGSTSGGSAGTGGEAGGSGTGGTGDPDAGSGDAGGTAGARGDAASDAPPTNEGGEAGGCLPAGTFTVVNDGSSGYIIDGGALNAAITLCRGSLYTFAIDAPGHPIYIRNQNGTSFTSGVTGNHISTGNLVFDVPLDAPSLLFYQCDVHDVMTGAILIVD